MPKEIIDEIYAEAVGKITFLKLEWKDWKKELPKSGSNIYVILKSEDRFLPIYAEYLDYELDPLYGRHRFQEVRFPGSRLPELYLGSKDAEEYLHAWAYALLIDEKNPFAKLK